MTRAILFYLTCYVRVAVAVAIAISVFYSSCVYKSERCKSTWDGEQERSEALA